MAEIPMVGGKRYTIGHTKICKYKHFLSTKDPWTLPDINIIFWYGKCRSPFG